MFRRRSQKSAVLRLREFIWPRNGWHRAGQYFWHRLHRLPGSPYSIAAGFATGGALSVTPLIGIHFFLAAVLAWLIRGNVIAAAFGTIIGNPWTFPIIWLTTYHLGRVLLGYGLSFEDDLDFTGMFSGLVRALLEADAATFMDQVWPIWFPMLIGSLLSALLTWFVMYTLCFKLTVSYQKRRQIRREAKKLARTSAQEQDLPA